MMSPRRRVGEKIRERNTGELGSPAPDLSLHKDLKEGFMGNSVEKEAQGSGDPKTWQWDFIIIILKL